MRHHCSFAGSWGFQRDPHGTQTVETLRPDQHIDVPLPWQVAFPELEHYSGYGWYSRSFDLTAESLQGEVLLHFGAVDYWCQVFINGHLAGEHEGGYTPFTLAIRRYLQEGHNQIAVWVYDSVQTHMSVERWPEYPDSVSGASVPFDANHIPHGKQEWYLNVGGIWQDVTLATVPISYLDHIRIDTNIHTGLASVTVETAGATNVSGVLTVLIEDRAGSGATATVLLVTGQQGYTVPVAVERCHLWDMDDPYLYTATVTLHTSLGDDELQVRFGFREIRTQAGRLFLNGQPLFLLSALDQDLYPHTIYTVPSEEYLRDQFVKAKQLGLNSLRCHIKPPDPRYLDLADEMGLLIWAEIPSWRTFYSKGSVHRNQLNLEDIIKQRVEQTLMEMIRRDCNHPSLMIWTLVNEDWGTALPLSAGDRAWVGEFYDRCKQLDPSRLVVDNSACPHPWGPNVHVHSDLDDFHVYANIPDQARSFDYAIEQFGLRPLWSYSQHGDAQRTGEEPLILSEFGNWGLPSLELLRAGYGGDPAWFKTGPWWSPWEGEPGWPANVDERFITLGLDKIWPDYEAFATATQWHQWAAMKWEIETMRRQPALAGYVVTEFTDAFWEANGLLDFLRNPKAYHHRFKEINAPDVIIPQPNRYAYWDDQHAFVTLHVSHYSSKDWAGAHVRWTMPGTAITGTCSIEPLARGTTRELSRVHWRLPVVDQTQMVQFQLVLSNGTGEELARNTLDLLVFPAVHRSPKQSQCLAVIPRHNPWYGTMKQLDMAPGLLASEGFSSEPVPLMPLEEDGEGEAVTDFEAAIRELGYRTTSRLNPNIKLAVTTHPTAELLQWVSNGGDLLFISTGASPFFWVQSRSGAYSGNWITSFSWIRSAIHERLLAPNPLSMPFIRVMPRGTILGVPVEDPALQSDVLAGMVAGWIRHPAVHTVQFRYGQGRVIMTTFGLEETLHDDPVAIAMFHDLIDYLHSDRCQPALMTGVVSSNAVVEP